jgi:hypothetical protein
MNLTQAAVLLGISPKTLRVAAEQGEIEATHPLAEGPCSSNGRSSNAKKPSASSSAFAYAGRTPQDQNISSPTFLNQ